MKKRRAKLFLVVLLLAIQFYSYRYAAHNRLYYDLIYVLIFYLAWRKSYLQALLGGFLLGLITDYFSLSLFGVFAFSRTLIAALINAIANRFDLTNRLLFFFTFALSLFVSNLFALLFLKLLFKYDFVLPMLIAQPLLTALIGSLLISVRKISNELGIV